jgi:hypothetical protein
MVRFQRTMKVRRGKQSTKWAKELLDYTNAAHEKHFQLFRSRFGNLSTIYWMADFEDLAALEAWQKKVGADPGYRALIKEAFDIIIAGTVEDTILESL